MNQSAIILTKLKPPNYLLQTCKNSIGTGVPEKNILYNRMSFQVYYVVQQG